MISFYMVGMLAIRGLITFVGLRRVFQVAEVSVQPLNPDKCGGLASLRDYALRLSYLIAALGLGIAGFLYITSRSLGPCVVHLPKEGTIRVETNCLKKVNSGDISEALKGHRTQLTSLEVLSKTESGEFILADDGKVSLEEEAKVDLVLAIWGQDFAPLKTDLVASLAGC